MENLKSLQEGGPEVIDETKQIAEALTKMVNEQKVPLEQALMQMFQSGVQQNQAVEVLMSMGYTEADIQSIFQSIQEKTQPKEEEPELIEEEPEEQQVQENQDLVQQEQPIAKKGKEKYNKGGGFRSWMNRNLGYISDNDRYDVPIQYSHLPTSKRDAGLDFVTNMFRLGKRAANVVKDAKARKNDSSYNKSLIKFGKDANPEDFYITDESIYQASQNNGNLITKDQAVQMMKDKSRFMYNPDTKAYSFALATNPYASQSEIQDQIDREMGSNYRDKYKEASLPQLENLLKFTRSFLPINQLGGGTHNTYYGQVGMEYPGTINQTEFPGFTFGDTSDYKASEDNRPLSFRNWFAQNYGSNLNFANQSQADLKQQYSSYLQDFDPYTYVSEDVKEKPKDKPGSILDPLRDIETNYTDEEVDAYMNLSEDLAASNFVNKGSMGKQPSVEAQQQLQDAMPKDTSATVNIKNKGAFSKALDTAADVSGLAVDVGRTLVDLKENAENIKKKNENTYRYAGDKFGTDIGKKGYWTVPDGILSPDKQYKIIGQNGKEMKNYNDYFMMRMGGINPMYDFFMDNELPIYQSMGEIPRPKTLGYLYDKYGMGKNNTINLDNVTDFNTRNKLAEINRAILERTGMDYVEETFSEKPKSKSRTYLPTLYSSGKPEVIYDRFGKPVINPETGEAIKGKNYSLDPESSVEYYQNQSFIKPEQRPNRPGRIDMEKYFGPNSKPVMSDQEWKAMQKAIRDPSAYGERKYGGQSYMDPFMPKRKLRKKKGGQIGNIATQTLKNLMKKYPNFKYSNYED